MRQLQALFAGLLLFCVASIAWSGGTAEGEGTEAAAAGDERLTISWAPFVGRDYLPVADSEVELLIEEKFNVNIDVVDYSIQDEEQVQLRLAEGSMPDFFQDFGYWQTLIDQDLVKPISEEMLRSNMPATVSKIEEVVGPDEFQAQLYIDGQVWGIPQWSAGYEGTQRTVIRQDWLDTVGISEVPETIPEFEEMLRAFTFDDPDGNGQDDTYGLNQGWFGFFPIYAAYGVHDGWGYSVDENGRVYSPIVQPEYKEVLGLLSSWYEMGVIDPEFVTDSRALHVRKFIEGRLGTLMDGDGWFFPTNSNGYIPRLKEADPDAEATLIMNPRRVNGEHSGMFRARLIWGRGYSKFFGYETSDEKIEKVMEILDSFASDWDWYLRAQYGVEGQDYTLDEGVVIPNPDLSQEEKIERGISIFSNTTPLTVPDLERIFSPANWEIRQDSLAHRRVIRGPGFAYTGINEAEQQYGADLGTIVSEFRVNVITGEIDLDSEWEDYVNLWMDAGGREVLSEYQAMYDEMYE